MKFYHVDTIGEIDANSTQHLIIHPNTDVHPFHFSGARSAFLEGVSPWGFGKLWQNLKSDEARPGLTLRSWIFELYRREHNINVPSRFQCLFACDSLESAEEFFNTRKPEAEDGFIFEIHSDEVFGPYYYDWFGGELLPAEMYRRAENYWNKLGFVREGGITGPVEYLIPLPCEVGDEVKAISKEIELNE